MFIGSGWLLYAGPIGRAAMHRHHALQIVVARAGSARIEDGAGREHRGAAIVVSADTPHAMRTSLPAAYLLYLDSESAGARSVSPAEGITARSRLHADPTLDSIIGPAGPNSFDGACGVARRVVELVAGRRAPSPPRARDPSVRRAIELLPALLAEGGSALRLAAIADAVDRSPQHFSRVFNKQVGISVPAYVRWARLRLIARSLAAGRTLTDAAHEAGFSDSAHLSRTFHETFGVRPSDLASCATWNVADIPLD